MDTNVIGSDVVNREDGLEMIYRMQHELNCIVGKDTINDPNKLDWLFGYAYQINDEARELEKCCLTKWWVKEYKDGGKLFETILDKENAKIEAIDVLHFLMSVFHILDMTPADIIEIYKLKHAKNIKRQQNNYSIAGKTEDDNQEIIESIRQDE